MNNIGALSWALIGGILPALLWLSFWLREDRKNPEPKRLIGRTFFFGMLAVLLVLPFQQAVNVYFPNMGFAAIFLWAALEEMFKFAAGYLGGLQTRDDNEPIDAMIYMVTAALGFVALENTLFLLGPLSHEHVTQSIITGNLRFVGASVLHVVSSGLVGSAIAFSFYRKWWKRAHKIALALCFAITLHTVFNLFILKGSNASGFTALIIVWIGAIYLFWAFEKSKTIAPRTR
ncbi:PrsW family intramembrane metalloprotease [Candidatus Parcubacteria bacterium]|nr:PrsW family intramembrane metalloprotease [Candidatus Parcubacteria bacterium]